MAALGVLVDKVKKKTGLKISVVKLVVEEILNCIKEELVNSKEIKIKEFGNFDIRNRKPTTKNN